MLAAIKERDWPRAIFVGAMAVAFIPIGMVFLLLGILCGFAKLWFMLGLDEVDTK